MIEVNNGFTITPKEGYRFNVIGWTKKGVHSEAGYPINIDKIAKRFSVDREGSIYRVEVYKENKFSGMVLVKFGRARSDDKLSAQIPVVSEPALIPGTSEPAKMKTM